MKGRFTVTLLILLVGIGAGLRIAGSVDPLWLDETWTMLLLRNVHAISDIFTSIHVDNNHYLNSVYLYLLGEHRLPLLYRLPSLIAGIAFFCLAPVPLFLEKRHREALILLLLLSTSFVLINVSGQARGYMPMLLCALGAWQLLRQYLRTDRPVIGVLFGVLATIALLWQLTFLEGEAFFLLFSWWKLRERQSTPSAILGRMILLHGLPLLCVVLLWMVDLRFMHPGIPFLHPLLSLLLQEWIWTIGWPLSKIVVALWLLCLGLLSYRSLLTMWKNNTPQQQGVLIGGVLISTCVVLFTSTGALAHHFVILSMMFLFWLAHVCSTEWHTGTWQRYGIVTLLCLYCAGNMWETGLLLSYGRGEFLPALHYMSTHDSSSVITIITPYPPWISHASSFYWPDGSNTKTLSIVSPTDTSASTAHWFVLPDDPYNRPERYASFSFDHATYMKVDAPFQARSGWTVYERKMP